MEKNMNNLIQHSRPTITASSIEDIVWNLKNNQISKGNKVKSFEYEIGLHVGAHYVKCSDSGTSALIIALLSLKRLSPKQNVLLPTYVCESVLCAIKFVGLNPIFYDHKQDWTPDVTSIIKKLSDDTLAIIVVHTMGVAFEDILLLKDLQVFIVEDCCQSFGLKINNHVAGTIGDIGIFSFNATKCLTTGEGGAIICSTNSIIEKIEDIMYQLNNSMIMSDISASLGLSQLEKYSDFLLKRTQIADFYLSNIKSKTISNYSNLKNTINYRFLLYFDDGMEFNTIKDEFSKYGISVRKGVDTLLNVSDEFKGAKKLFNNTLSIPIYPSLSAEEINKVTDVSNKILSTYEN
jgi:perosamine synthetase